MTKIKEQPNFPVIGITDAVPVDRNTSDGYILLGDLKTQWIDPIEDSVTSLTSQVVTLSNNYLLKTGGTVTGHIDLTGGPYSGRNAIDYTYLGQRLNEYLQLSGGNMSGYIKLNADPTEGLHPVTLQYLQSYVGELPVGFIHIPEIYDASSNLIPTTYAGSSIQKGNSFNIINAGTLSGLFFLEEGDFLIALVDTPGVVLANWMAINSNVSISTDIVRGLIEIATQAEVNIGTDYSRAVTPLTLKTHLDSRLVFSSIGTNIYDTLSGYQIFNSGKVFSLFSPTTTFNSSNYSIAIQASGGIITAERAIVLGTVGRSSEQSLTTYMESLRFYGGLQTNPRLFTDSGNIQNTEFICILNANSSPASPVNMPNNPKEGQMHIIRNSGIGTYTLDGNGIEFSLTDGTNVFTIEDFNPGKSIVVVYSSNSWIIIAEGTTGTVSPPGGSESTTASNIGSGVNIFSSEVGDDLQFKSILGASGITITDDGPTVTIGLSGGGSSMTSFSISDESTTESITNLETLTIRGSNALTVSLASDTFTIDLDTTGTSTGDTLKIVSPGVYAFAAPGGGGAYTFSSGLTDISGSVKLGGTLSQNTLIDTSSFSFSVGTGALSLVVDGNNAGFKTISSESQKYSTTSIIDYTVNSGLIQNSSDRGAGSANVAYNRMRSLDTISGITSPVTFQTFTDLTYIGIGPGSEAGFSFDFGTPSVGSNRELTFRADLSNAGSTASVFVEPDVTWYFFKSPFTTLSNHPDQGTAIAAGLTYGQMYHTDGVLKYIY